ncbi:MAG: hypothetical protein NC930_04510 [Candidatus Omnitrophica bacterium]|nr:hypothetical protein [Candidatus Omnitrophota bacterium]
MRWLVLDEVKMIQKKKIASTRSRVPAGSISPQLLMMEMMAQTGALLLGAEKDFEEDLIFAKIDQADFNDIGLTGEVIEIEATSENLRPEGAWLEGTIRSRERIVAQSRFLLMNVGHFIPGQVKSFTFHDRFMDYFQVREKIQA